MRVKAVGVREKVIKSLRMVTSRSSQGCMDEVPKAGPTQGGKRHRVQRIGPKAVVGLEVVGSLM